MQRVVSVILGGGKGSRLFPLTHERAKPAVPLFGKYRLLDVTLSNCINSGINKVFVLTQFLSASLHRHLMMTYKFDGFSQGFVEILAAEQTPRSTEWFQGTADAVRATLRHIHYFNSEQTLILSGDHLYRMDYGQLVQHHRGQDAAITLAVYLVERHDAERMGLLQVDDAGLVTDFVEKPKDPEVIERFRAPRALCEAMGVSTEVPRYLASMGIYVFDSMVLEKCLSGTENDFGSEIIPQAIGKMRVVAYPFHGYWADIGTISAFFDANLEAARANPPFPLYSPGAPIFTHGRFLAPARIIQSTIRDSLITEGTDIHGAVISDSVIGVRSTIRPGATLKEVVMMGADFFEGEREVHALVEDGVHVPMGIGQDAHLTRCIIDKNARIGDGVIVARKGANENYDGEGYYVRDGITVIPKNAIIAAGRTL